MESQMPRPHGQDYDDQHLPSVGLPGVIEGEDEHHHEKKSVLKKVKAKAKKIKDTLTKHGHGHSHDEEEEEDEEEEMDPEVHDPPLHSAAIRSGVTGQQPGVNLGKPSLLVEDRYDSKYTDPPTKSFVQWQEEEGSGQTGDNMGRPTAVGVGHAPDNRDVSAGNVVRGREEKTGQGKIDMGTPTAMEEDPHAPLAQPELSNYQSKVIDPTGDSGGEAGITPILHAFNKMTVYDESESKPPSEAKDPGLALKSSDASSKPEEDRPHDTVTEGQRTYTEMISSATSVIADKAIAATNVVASKIGYGYKGEKDKGQEKGASMKEYLTEKLRPSDEDKALSEAISDALHKRKQEAGTETEKPMGKVTESEEVKKRLGTTRDEQDLDREGIDSQAAAAANLSATGRAVVDRLKGAVGSWWSVGGDQSSQIPQAPQDTTRGEEAGPGHDQDGVGERRLQESGN